MSCAQKYCSAPAARCLLQTIKKTGKKRCANTVNVASVRVWEFENFQQLLCNHHQNRWQSPVSPLESTIIIDQQSPIQVGWKMQLTLGLREEERGGGANWGIFYELQHTPEPSQAPSSESLAYSREINHRTVSGERDTNSWTCNSSCSPWIHSMLF